MYGPYPARTLHIRQTRLFILYKRFIVKGAQYACARLLSWCNAIVVSHSVEILQESCSTEYQSAGGLQTTVIRETPFHCNIYGSSSIYQKLKDWMQCNTNTCVMKNVQSARHMGLSCHRHVKNRPASIRFLRAAVCSVLYCADVGAQFG